MRCLCGERHDCIVLFAYLAVICILFIISLLSFRMRWLNDVPFMTYGFRALMNIEYGGRNFTVSVPPLPNGTESTALSSAVPEEIALPGNWVIDFFEMGGYDPRTDIFVLVGWMFCMHLVSIIYLLWNKHRTRRVFVYSDK